jgi:uncharacterized membrane protein (TIGR02234 family)
VNPRRELTVAVLLCAVGALLALWATTRDWAVLVTERPVPLPAVRDVRSGGDAAPAAAALTLVGLAGAAALLAVRGAGRLLVGVLLLLAGIGVAAGGIAVLADGITAGPATDVRLSAGWPVLCVAGGVLVALGGLLATVRGRRWSALGRKYDAPSARRAPADPWEALDRGEDPTAH